MNRINPTTVFLATLVLVLTVFFVPDVVGGILLLVLAAFAIWLVVKVWDRLPPVGRAIRLLVLGLLLIMALTRLT